MPHGPRIPKGCYALPDWNGDILVCDPRGALNELSRVVVHLRDDARLRLVGTYAPRAGGSEKKCIRIRLDGAGAPGTYHIFDKDLVTVMKIVDVYPGGTVEP